MIEGRRQEEEERPGNGRRNGVGEEMGRRSRRLEKQEAGEVSVKIIRGSKNRWHEKHNAWE